MNVEQMIDQVLYDTKNVAKKVNVWDYNQTYLTHVCKEVTIDGLWMEFGVYRGRTISIIAEQTSNNIYGFDCFEGLPEFWDNDNPKGVYSVGGEIPIGAIDGPAHLNPGMYEPIPTRVMKPWAKNIKLVKGLFEDSLPIFLEQHNEQAAFINIDSDLYSSAKTVLTLLKNRIKHGTIITFDELVDYPTFREHEIKAFAEFLIDTGFSYEALYHQSLASYSQASFRIIKE
jgi:hypothetical protein